MSRLIEHNLGYATFICQLTVFHRQLFSPLRHDIFCIYIRKHKAENPMIILIFFWLELLQRKKGRKLLFHYFLLGEDQIPHGFEDLN